MIVSALDTASDLPRLRARRGIAAATALGALVVIGLLITGAYFTSSQQGNAGRATAMQEQAFRVAEAGLAEAISGWNSATARSNTTVGAQWSSGVVVQGIPGNAAQPTVTITRLNANVFHVLSVAEAGAGNTAATRSVSELVRMLTPTFNLLGALTVRGATKIGGSSLINGNDQAPAGWTCPALQPALPGIAIPDIDNISTSGCTSYNCVSGDPKIEENSAAAADSTYFKYGDTDWAELVETATLTMTTNPNPAPAYTATGTCNTSLQSNWGDVNRALPTPGACETYFPIIYFPGNAKLTGGTGQGILLVEGDLEVQGGFKFFGPVIVRGRLKTAGTGGHFNGGVMAANVDLEENSVLGDAVINYSNCAIQSAINGAGGPAVAVRHRAWAESF